MIESDNVIITCGSLTGKDMFVCTLPAIDTVCSPVAQLVHDCNAIAPNTENIGWLFFLLLALFIQKL